MQQLQFEAAWNKTLCTEDRELIQTIFNETKNVDNSGIHFSPIREAFNHKKELLVTVLIHNFTQNPYMFDNTRIVYENTQEIIAEKLFTFKSLVIPPFVSIPWTFIFPEDSYTKKTSLSNGQLRIG